MKKKSLNYSELSVFVNSRRSKDNSALKILDICPGDNPLPKFDLRDQVYSIDIDKTSKASLHQNILDEWPTNFNHFDFIYASHCMEHFYPKDRDLVINKLFNSLKKGGVLLIRVPHFSDIQGVGWEHHTLYGSNSFYSLAHGKNPQLPKFKILYIGLYYGTLHSFFKKSSFLKKIINKCLNMSHRLSDLFLCRIIGGISEVQCLLEK